MEWSTTSNLENVRVGFMRPPWPELSFHYDPYAAGNSYMPADTQTGPVISLPESEKLRSNNNNEMMIKKKRLTSGQIAWLERCFQEEIKLDSERKVKLSRELGLQPRQIAVWFQNRRARWKAKQLEQLYDSLKQDYDVVYREKQILHEEVKNLRAILRLREEGLMKKQISSDEEYIPRRENLSSSNQICCMNQYYNNHQMVVASTEFQ